MKNIIILLSISLGFICCTAPKYITKKQSEINKLDLDNSITNYIPIADNDLEASTVLDSTYCLLTNKKYLKLEKYINQLESSGNNSSDFYLSKTLLQITNGDYPNAVKSVRLINETDYILLKRLLSIDMNNELAKTNGVFDYNGFLKRYQDLIDSFPENESLKKIVAIRLRYLRYNY